MNCSSKSRWRVMLALRLGGDESGEVNGGRKVGKVQQEGTNGKANEAGRQQKRMNWFWPFFFSSLGTFNSFPSSLLLTCVFLVFCTLHSAVCMNF